MADRRAVMRRSSSKNINMQNSRTSLVAGRCACVDFSVDMLFTLHPGNVSTGDVSVAAAAAASPTSYEPQPVPHWANATEVKKTAFDICCDMTL